MRYVFGAVLASAGLLAAATALADTAYVVDKVTITGSKTVPPEKLYALIQEHKGSRVTQADIVADQDVITKALGEANVVGGIKTSMATKSNKHIEVTFAVEDHGAQAPIVTKVAPKLRQEIFVGNKAISSDKLMAASGLTPGEALSNEKVAAAEQAIAAAYKAAKIPVDMSLNGTTQAVGSGQVDVTWTIVEKKAKKKRNTDDQGQKVDD